MQWASAFRVQGAGLWAVIVYDLASKVCVQGVGRPCHGNMKPAPPSSQTLAGGNPALDLSGCSPSTPVETLNPKP